MSEPPLAARTCERCRGALIHQAGPDGQPVWRHYWSRKIDCEGGVEGLLDLPVYQRVSVIEAVNEGGVILGMRGEVAALFTGSLRDGGLHFDTDMHGTKRPGEAVEMSIAGLVQLHDLIERFLRTGPDEDGVFGEGE